MTDLQLSPGTPLPPGAQPSTPTAVARLSVLVAGADADAVIEAARAFVHVVPVRDGVFDLEFRYADPLGAIAILDVYLRRLKLGGWREHVSIELTQRASTPRPPEP